MGFQPVTIPKLLASSAEWTNPQGVFEVTYSGYKIVLLMNTMEIEGLYITTGQQPALYLSKVSTFWKFITEWDSNPWYYTAVLYASQRKLQHKLATYCTVL